MPDEWNVELNNLKLDRKIKVALVANFKAIAKNHNNFENKKLDVGNFLALPGTCCGNCRELRTLLLNVLLLSSSLSKYLKRIWALLDVCCVSFGTVTSPTL